MVRVIHLSPVHSDFQTQRSLEYMRRDLGADGSALTLGPGGDVRNVPMAAIALRRLLRRGAEVVHAWGPSALAAAAWAGCRRIIYSPLPDSPLLLGRWFGAAAAGRYLRVVCPSEAMRRALVEQGVAAERCQVIHPPVDFARVPSGGNALLRAELGFGESDRVVLLPGESTHDASHRAGVWALSILYVMEERERVLVWGRGRQAESLARLGKRLAQHDLVTLAEQRLGRAVEFEQLTAVAEAAVVPAQGNAAVLPLLICMAAGLPIVAGFTPAAAEFLQDRQTALVLAPATPKALAQGIMELRQNRSLRDRLIESARAKAKACYSLPKFLDQWRCTYLVMGERGTSVRV